MILICKENENKMLTVSTEEFNNWLKENNIEWIVKENGKCAMDIVNCSNKHEPFDFVLFKKFDIELLHFEYFKDEGKRKTNLLEFKFTYYKHGYEYNNLLNNMITDNDKYIQMVRDNLRQNNISSIEASYLIERKGLDISCL